MSQLTVRPDQTKKYFHASQALTDLGFEDNGEVYGDKNPVSGVIKKYKIFYNAEKGKYYYFVSMDNFNTTIYKIVLKELPRPIGHYSYN
jgi:hypothetical protein